MRGLGPLPDSRPGSRQAVPLDRAGHASRAAATAGLPDGPFRGVPVLMKDIGGLFGKNMPLPMRVGMEGSGVVTAVGTDAVGPRGPISVGDEVIMYRINGACADRVVVEATTGVGRWSVWVDAATGDAIWAAADAGLVINPDGLKNQIEGGIIQSASWTLHEEVKFDTTGTAMPLPLEIFKYEPSAK